MIAKFPKEPASKINDGQVGELGWRCETDDVDTANHVHET